MDFGQVTEPYISPLRETAERVAAPFPARYHEAVASQHVDPQNRLGTGRGRKRDQNVGPG